MDVALALLWRIQLWMVALFHPAMTLIAVHSGLATTFLNRLDLDCEVPCLTFFREIFIVAWIPSVVLDVVRIWTIAAIVAACG